MSKKNEHYVSNKKFLSAMIEYQEKRQENAEKGLPEPRPSDYIGECFLKIANHLSLKPNFRNYAFREEMIGDGIENCIQYMNNFNPEKSNNPFAYFTQIIYYAFLRRIAKEKKQLYTKMKYGQHCNISELTRELAESNQGENFDTNIKYSDWSQEYVNDFIEEYEEKLNGKNNS